MDPTDILRFRHKDLCKIMSTVAFLKTNSWKSPKCPFCRNLIKFMIVYPWNGKPWHFHKERENYQCVLIWNELSVLSRKNKVQDRMCHLQGACNTYVHQRVMNVSQGQCDSKVRSGLRPQSVGEERYCGCSSSRHDNKETCSLGVNMENLYERGILRPWKNIKWIIYTYDL